jgi:hypothetical protein
LARLANEIRKISIGPGHAELVIVGQISRVFLRRQLSLGRHGLLYRRLAFGPCLKRIVLLVSHVDLAEGERSRLALLVVVLEVGGRDHAPNLLEFASRGLYQV